MINWFEVSARYFGRGAKYMTATEHLRMQNVNDSNDRYNSPFFIILLDSQGKCNNNETREMFMFSFL